MESTSPWKDERWLPGVLNYAQMTSLKKCGLILNSTGTIDRDASALDLHLSSEAYKMEKGSIKPFNKNYSDILNDGFYAAKLTTDSDGSFTLKVNECYVFKIAERLHPAITHDSPFYGQATAKSSIGRVDVIARLIVDGMKEYEKFSPKEISTGDMFLEITPITFDVKVKEGISISQLRFCNGDFEDSIIKDEKFLDSVLNLSSPSKNYGTLSVDVSNFKVSSSVTAAAYCAKSSAGKSIELWGENKYDPFEFWQPVQSQEIQSVKSITIIKNNFYILRSIERISLPEGVCIYCRAMDETLGEMRIHYAGFVHPLFGLKRTGIKGTPLIFEVRGHNVDVLLTQAEILARLIFYRMSTLAAEPKRKKVKSAQVQTSNVPYGEQELNLSKIFKKP
ncbi:MAG TPA: 2'-deoxycytidine 5'-triphosphate deaminase [Chitinophagaceae bacterium]|nr:2'-deoxycytidine 5'-triphosphate deaminase [Chitinophagaceae bacterium]